MFVYSIEYQNSLHSLLKQIVGSFTIMSDHYQVVGQNNRNALVQSKRVAPYHEDITRVQPFEPSSISPGQYTKIKLDFKHATDRELILNDIRLCFNLDLSARSTVGKVYAVRGTDLIREMVVKINEDIVFKADKRSELSMLWEMNNHKTGGVPSKVNHAFLLNYGNIPSGLGQNLFFKSSDSTFYQDLTGTTYTDATTGPYSETKKVTQTGLERHDGLPRLIYDDTPSPDYSFRFNISLNQLLGPVFHRLHMRRIEYVQIELMFEPWVSSEDTQNFLLFKNPPTNTTYPVHPYSVAKFTNLEIRQYRTTLLDGITGFTLPDNRMLSWLMHRYSRREYTWDFSDSTATFLDIQLHDWEIRTNIVRVWWMLKPTRGGNATNGFYNLGDQKDGFENVYGAEVRWKNDVVLDLATTFDVYRHYILSDNKRYGFEDPFVTFNKLTFPYDRSDMSTVKEMDGQMHSHSWVDDSNIDRKNVVGGLRYEFPIYHVDLNMNVQHSVTGTELIGGIVNDTSDYVIRIKRPTDKPSFVNSSSRTLWVFLEYQTLVNLSAGSNQFNRGSQQITKQLNPQ